ncbi:MAG: 6-bladed beta-propeller, partial [Candidatus Aminicenantes bacterium]|nr:6-bladed beta-propeller [Candidatus Aminicenantes bacterium]
MKKTMYLILITFILSYCGTQQEKVDKVIEDGVEVVINHLEPYQIGNISSFTLEEVLKIDTEEDEISNLGIADIFGFEVSSVGEIFILRAYKGEGDFIFKFDRDGEFLKSFGPQGQGPGEFQNPHHIALDSEDNIVIIDLARGPLLKYDKDGTFLDDHEMPGGDIRVTSGPRANLLVWGMSYNPDKEKALYSFKLKLLNPDLEVLQLIDKFSVRVSPEKMGATEPLLYWSASHDNIYVANEERGYEIWVLDFKGKLIRKIQKEYRKIPVSENYKKKTLHSFPEYMREKMKDVLYFPAFHPPIQSIVAGDDGVLLVSTFEEGKNPGEFMFDIFNEEGV